MQGRTGGARTRAQGVWLRVGSLRGASLRVALIAICGLAVAACTTTGSRPGPNATVAFESIDGPPPAAFKKLVQKLNDEAEAKKVPIVSRETPAPYRIRGYVALGIQKKQKRTIVSWVWDVYDAEQKRSFRLSGEEVAGPAGREPWDAANDEVLSRVARAGIERLAAYFQSPASVASEPAAEPVPSGDGDRNMTVASVPGRDDFRPESQGIFRLFRNDPAPSPSPSMQAEAPLDTSVPLPRRRPASAVRLSEDKVAMAVPGL
ncbi:MAG TPA: hypothetical protein VJL90_03020 [Pseudorhodoplanes sp.]|nr:hypothetical protein [Pseudorhodoplanes sp.]